MRCDREGAEREIRTLRLLVFFTAFSCLVFELVIARLADFFVGFRNSFLALPVTFLGLALGSLNVHFRPTTVERFTVRSSVTTLAGVSFLTLFTVFSLLARGFNIVAADEVGFYLSDAFAKTAVFVVGFIIPFFVFGRILTICYQRERDHIGEVYSADFFGAAAGCFVTPVLFHFVSLPEVVLVWMLAVSAIVVFFVHTSTRRTAGLIAALLAVNLGVYAGVRRLESGIEYDYYSQVPNQPHTREIASVWNEFSRVQLVKFEYPGGAGSHYKVIHDDARSNVHVRAYVPGRTTEPEILDALEAPFIMKRSVPNVLVMFAGCGDEMIRLNAMSKGEARITGVELNRACVDLPANARELRSFRIAEFFSLPTISMRFMEGRSFLMQNDDKFDLVFVGSSAGTGLQVTGHTRKYLYTKEALELYLKALTPGGMLVFDYQATDYLVEILKSIFHDQGRSDLDKCLILLRSRGGKNIHSINDLIFSPAGFSADEVNRLTAFGPSARDQVRFAPWLATVQPREDKLIHGPLVPASELVVDDRPFLLDLHFGNYKLVLSKAEQKNLPVYEAWLRISTLLLLCIIAAAVIGLALTRRLGRPSPVVVAYLLLTGFCYMLVEVALMAKLELYLQNPSVSMATVISIFLMTSGLGSLWHKRVVNRVKMVVFPAIVALVDRLVATGAGDVVPITYGLSTLSSVIGASYAMTFMIPWGFNALLLQGAAGYCLIALLVVVHAYALKRPLLVG